MLSLRELKHVVITGQLACGFGQFDILLARTGHVTFKNPFWQKIENIPNYNVFYLDD